MGKLLSCLQLQTFLIMWMLYSVRAAPYSKYGRTCKDIGCLPRQVCVMAYDSCSFNQQEGSNCGRYPTCKASSDNQPQQQNTGPSTKAPSTNPTHNIWNIPTTTTTRRTTTTTTTRRQWTTKSPYYNPSNPSYGGGGNYFGNRYGDDDIGGSIYNRPTQKPSSSGSSDISGFLSGLSSILGTGDLNKIVKSFGGSGGGGGGGSSGSGGFGSLFGSDTRPIQENRGYRGSLFSENTARTSSNNDYSAYPVTRYGDAPPSAPASNQASNPSGGASHGTYGWKLS